VLEILRSKLKKNTKQKNNNLQKMLLMLPRVKEVTIKKVTYLACIGNHECKCHLYDFNYPNLAGLGLPPCRCQLGNAPK